MDWELSLCVLLHQAHSVEEFFCSVLQQTTAHNKKYHQWFGPTIPEIDVFWVKSITVSHIPYPVALYHTDPQAMPMSAANAQAPFPICSAPFSVCQILCTSKFVMNVAAGFARLLFHI